MSTRSRSLALGALILSAAAMLAPVGASAQLVEGADFRRLSPPHPTSSPGKIEVLEFFSYGCPHCAKFFPMVSAWAAKLPKDVVFKRVAVSYGRPAWTNLARAYYALQATSELTKFDGPLFHAIHDDHLQLFDAQQIADWIGSKGGDADKFTNAYASFGINNQTVQADQLVEDYQIDGVPTLAVNGRYVVLSPQEATDEEQVFKTMLDRADQLIARVRRDQGAPAPAAKRP